MSDKKRLFLIDAYALIFRGYYAFIKNPRINSKGLDTSAILGFTNSLFDVIKREKPDYMAVCFDKGGSQDRIEIFEDYKANREETPEGIKIAVPIIEDILKSLNISILVKEGYEADDIIGTIAKKAKTQNFETYMVTPDKDFAQLVEEDIYMYRPVFGGGYETWGVKEVLNKFEISRTSQVIDFLAMKGDSVDNIPGLPGVGDKTAKKFIAEFGSMENLLNNTDKLKGKLKEKVEANKEKGLLSKKLATIILDVPIEFNPIEFKFEVKNTEDLKKIFLELEFRRLIDSVDKTFGIQLTDSTNSITKKNNKSEITKLESQTQKFSAGSGQFSLFDGTENESEKIEYLRKDINNTNHYYQKIDTELATNLFFKKILNQSLVSYSIYSNNIDPLTDDILGIAFSWEENKCYYISAENNNSIKFFKKFFENSSIEKTSQNIKTDIKILKKYGITINGKIFDITLAHYLINPDISHDLSLLSETYLNYSKINLQLLLGKGKLKKEISNLETNIIIDIACENCDIILQLKSLFSKELIDSNLITLFNKIETPLLKVLAEMEYEGINLDVNFLKSLSNDLNSDLIKLENKIFLEAGEKFNISSPKQLGEVLFEKMQLSKNPKKTKSGQYSTAEDILAELSKKHDFVKKILKFRSLSKLKNTYVDSLPEQVLKKTKRVHTEYLQTVASTGRLSSINPNLQNIPIRTERGKQIRKAFIPKNKDYTILAADYSQIELRIIASISDEENMIMAFKNNEDIHASTAAQVFDIDLKDVSKSQRSNAKTVNFGIIYGVSAFGLSNQTNLSRSESKDLIDTYYKKYSKLKTFISKQISLARSNGYVETLSGRKRYLRNINSSNGLIRSAAERNAVNAPIQGTAADIIKIAMINIFNKFSEAKLKSKMLLQVHDELVFDVFNDEIELVKSIIKQEMENAFTLKVPLTIDMDQGNNWLEAH